MSVNETPLSLVPEERATLYTLLSLSPYDRVRIGRRTEGLETQKEAYLV